MGLYEDFQELLSSRYSPEDTSVILNMLRVVGNDYTFEKQETALSTEVGDDTEALIKSFLCQKLVEGLSKRSIEYYDGTLHRIYERTKIPLRLMTSDKVLAYLAQRQLMDGACATTRNNELRVMRTFYSWAVSYEAVVRDPTLKVKAIKCAKVVKKPFSEMELEKLRIEAEKKKSPLKWCAIIEVLASTGCRVSELCGLNRSDIDGDRAIVHGKGSKDRFVYLNARAQIALARYMDSRQDVFPALFIGEPAGGKGITERMTVGGVESGIRELGKKCGIEKVHPHRFRRTTATLALNRGMPIDQVSKMLGHEQLSTTQIYAQTSEENLAVSHKKFVT